MKATINRSFNDEVEVMLSNTWLKELTYGANANERGRPKDEEGASNTREREDGGLEETANANATATSKHAESYAAATETKPTAVTQLSVDDDDDDDGAAIAAVKGFDWCYWKK